METMTPLDEAIEAVGRLLSAVPPEVLVSSTVIGDQAGDVEILMLRPDRELPPDHLLFGLDKDGVAESWFFATRAVGSLSDIAFEDLELVSRVREAGERFGYPVVEYVLVKDGEALRMSTTEYWQ